MMHVDWRVDHYPMQIHYSGINIATYIEITTIMECQMSRVILSYSSVNCLSCPLFIVIDHTDHMTIAAIFDNRENSFLYKFW